MMIPPVGSMWQIGSADVVARIKPDSDLLHDDFIVISPKECITVLSSIVDPLTNNNTVCHILRNSDGMKLWLQSTWFSNKYHTYLTRVA